MKSAPPSATSTFDSFDGESVIKAVVTAVAAAKDVSTADVTPPLYDAIDPDALERVITSLPSSPDEPAGYVEFPYSGCEITVTGDGHVSATPERLTSSKRSSG